MRIPIRSGDERDESEGANAADAEGREAGGDRAPTSASAPPTPIDVPADVRVQELEAALGKMRQEQEAMREQLLRLMADFDNYRKRMARQVEDIKQSAAAESVNAVLPAIDNLERALSAAQQDGSPASAQIAAGVSMVLKQFKDALAKVGVRELQVQGEPFDPMRHEAVEVVAVAPSQDGLVVEEVQRGYMIHDRLLRPAKVVVGKAVREAGHGGA